MRIIYVLWLVFVMLNTILCRPEEPQYKLCFPEKGFFSERGGILQLRIFNGVCKGCSELQNCTTFHGGIQIQELGGRPNSPTNTRALRDQMHFPKLTEITGHLIVSLLHFTVDLKDVFPNLAVIRGGKLFLDYSLVIYMNEGLRTIYLPSLTVILSGGIRIEKNINLCYAKTIRWKSIMRTSVDDESALVIADNNNDCYDLCYKGKCFPPAGHGASGQQYCWGAGTPHDYSCQTLCNTKCGDAGCLRLSSTHCCHPLCLGGCSKINSQFHCHACKHFRLTSGECVDKCPGNLLEVNNFECLPSCPTNYFQLEGKCVTECPAGYIAKKEVNFLNMFIKGKCEKCIDKRCPRVCAANSKDGTQLLLDSLSAVRKNKGCTEIEANLVIQIRGGGGSISKDLEDSLGMLEKVKGYILIRESASIVSLKFLKNLKTIEPRQTLSIKLLKFVPFLYNKRYALTIMDNPKLEKLWDFHPNLTVTAGGVLVRMNPRLCTSKIEPLVKILTRGNKTNVANMDISKTTNGNDVECQVRAINLTLTEIVGSSRSHCSNICILAKWNEVRIDDDYRNVLFYTVSYREAPNDEITELDDVYSYNGKTVWTKIEVPAKEVSGVNATAYQQARLIIMRYVGSLKPHTLYAFYVEAVTLDKKGAKSNLQFIKTREMVPSAVVGLDASYLNDHSLLVKWQPPLYPNGKIIKYILEYQKSDYSVWEQDNINWCSRELVRSQAQTSPNKPVQKPGKCNVTCVCEKEKEIIKPEKQAAIFAKEFQDALFKTVFTKKKDDNPTTQPFVNVTTTMYPITQIVSNRTNCSSNSQDPSCTTQSATPTSGPVNTTPSTSPLTNINDTLKPTNATTTNVSPVTRIEINGTKKEFLITGLRHFVDYKITVCACTNAGCSNECSSIKGRTGKKGLADNLQGPIKVHVSNATRKYNISWVAPRDPNSVVLKYDVEIRYMLRDNPEIICRQGHGSKWVEKEGLSGNYTARVRAITPAGNGSWSNLVTFYIAHESTDGNFQGKIQEKLDVGVIVGAGLAAFIVIVLVCGLIVWYITRKRYEEKQIHTVLYASVNPEYMNSSDVYIADEWEVPRDKIKLIRELGQGSFGMVYEGEAIDIVKDHPRCRVAVKTVSENASVKDRIEFLQEASIMKAFHCYHVVELLGVVSDGQPTLVIMELMHNGDLKNHLRSRRPGEGGDLPPPTINEMLQMAGEIADGMAYLASRKFVHRDLAARNCMVNENLTVKIGDFGMTRDIYETDYYRKGGKGLLPVRWMAPESLKDGVFTSPSDVWSYGVVLWEMVTYASQPYPGKSNEEVLKFVVDGGVMEQPQDAPHELYELMTSCWQFKPKTRPTFLAIINMIEDSLSENFKKKSFYSNLPRAQLQEMLKCRSFHIPRQRAETIQNEMESSA